MASRSFFAAAAGLAALATMTAAAVPAAHAQDPTTKPAASEKWRIAPTIETNIDVDTAYVRIKREFGFNTLEERLATTPGVYGSAQELYRNGFMFSAEPGARYLMRDRTGPQKMGRIVQIEVRKEGAGSLVEFAFATAGLASVSVYEKELRARIVGALE